MSVLSFLKKAAICSSVPSCSAVIVAAGSARRMKGEDKIVSVLSGHPVIYYAILAFQQSELVSEIVVVTREDLIDPVRRLCDEAGFTKVAAIVAGGAERPDSVQNGVDRVSKQAELIAIHDGARPLIGDAVITASIRAAARWGAAAPAVPVKDTIKIAQNGVVSSTPDRSRLYSVQTPQVFEASVLRAALQKAREDSAAVTDDCSAVERLGFPVHLVDGSYENIKITTPSDLALANLYLNEREKS